LSPKRYALAATAITATLLLAACGSSTDDATATVSAGAGTGTIAVDTAAAAALPAQYKTASVNVASDIPTAPMEYLDENENITGIDYDLSQALGAKLGVKFDFRKQAWDSIIPSLQSGKHDIIISGMNDTLERQKTLSYVDYMHAGFAILVKKGNPAGITTLLDLCGTTVAVQKSTVQGDILRSQTAACSAKGKGPISLLELPSEPDTQTAIRAGKATAEVVDAAVAEYSAKTAGGGSYFETVKDPANPAGYNPVYTGIGVLKANTGLVEAIRLGLQSLIDDGTYKTLMDKYSLGTYGVDKAGTNQGTS
jgi:polar amino acid transport system substrate-binding protein